MSRITPRLTLRTLLASLLMASPAIAGAAESSIAAIGGSLPTGGRITYSGDLTRVYQLGPGGQAEGKLVLHNPTGETRSARIYQTDYVFTAEGSASYGTPGSNPRSTAPWIELGEREAVLGTGETRTVSFKVNVPSKDRLSGTYWSMIMVEPITDMPAKADPHTVTVRSVMRYGVQVVVQVGDNAEPKPSISHQEIVNDNGRHLLQFDLANDGERWLQPKVEVRVFDGKGRALPAVPGRKARVYPGTSVRHRIELPPLSAGDYLALIVIDTDDETYGAQYHFHLDD